jgi:hypothetical protein
MVHEAIIIIFYPSMYLLDSVPVRDLSDLRQFMVTGTL